MSITQSDIIGARIMEVWEKRETTSDSLDICEVYFKVDRGFYFQLPSAGYRWDQAVLPASAKLQGQPSRFARFFSRLLPANEFDRLLVTLRSSPIAHVLTNGEPPDDSMIILANGTQIFCRTVCPVGIGAGLLYSGDDKTRIDVRGYRTFWDTPENTSPTPAETD